MSSACINQGWETLLKPDWLQSLRETRFLSRCRNGGASPNELHTFVKQQYYYSRHFTRYLNALISNLPDEEDRIALTENLFDEMGNNGGTPHTVIYRRMMAAMHLTQENSAVFPETEGLIETMLECCRNPREMVGLGAICLGAEAIVPDVYTDIVAGFKSIGEPMENLEFFTIHIGCDDAHAITMRAIILRKLENNPRSIVDLEYGAVRAISARAAFFSAVSERSSPTR